MRGEKERIAFVTHHVNATGGQDRCTLEVARRMSLRWPVDVYAFTFVPGNERHDGGGDIRFHPVRPFVSRPMLLKSPLFQARTYRPLQRARQDRPRSLIHTAGACAFVADVIQVHYVHAAWDAARRRFPVRLDRARSEHPSEHLRGRYQHAVTTYDRWSERHCFTPDKTYIAVSRRVASELYEHYGLEENVRVVHHAVDTAKFAPVSKGSEHARAAVRAHLGFAREDVVVAFVGAFERKGLPVVLDAVALLPRSARRRVRVLAIGEGDRAAIRRQAVRLGVADRVCIESPKSNIADYYRASDVFAFPTLYEPFGLVVLEAMASGLPTLVSRCAGAAEMVDDECGAVLDDPNAPEKLAAALAPIVEDASLRSRMGKAARAVALRRTWEDVADEYAAVLAPLMR